jgi:His-Xaa-Ser system radical SAM maturase HxsC
VIALRAAIANRSISVTLRTTEYRVVQTADDPGDRSRLAYLVDDAADSSPPGFGLYLGRHKLPAAPNSLHLPTPLHYLRAGDIIGVTPDGGEVAVLWRTSSAQNFLLLTERCDNYCLMCSQPPKDRNDDWLLKRAGRVLDLLPKETEGIGITGGEPTLYGTAFLDFLRHCTVRLPDAEVHILTNGRRFADPSFASEYATIRNPRIMAGIPIYGSEPSLHDIVVQAEGAFNETVEGILNLAAYDQRVEIRVVVHRHTASALVDIAEFITRNIPFVEQVALMGLEITGLARSNINDLWIDPTDYQVQLSEAAQVLDEAGIRTLIYNHQLCVLPPEMHRFAVKSISDWKNGYIEVCESCEARVACGGFFTSGVLRPSRAIKALRLAS